MPSAIVIFIGLSFGDARVWLWIPSFLVMGVACLVNTARCGRLHCFITGPIHLLSAIYVALSAFGPVPVRPGIFLLVVFGLTTLAFLAERARGTYRANQKLP